MQFTPPTAPGLLCLPWLPQCLQSNFKQACLHTLLFAMASCSQRRVRSAMVPPRYCCVPLRTEAPTEAWYCSQCSRARQEAAKAQQAARLARKRQRQEQRRQRRRQRQLDLQERQRQQLGQEHPAAASMPAPPPDKRQEDGKEVGRAQAQQEGASQPEQTAGGVGGAGSAAAAAPIAAPTAAAAAVAPPAGSQQGGAAQRKRSGLAAAIAAMVSGGPAAAAQAGGQHPSRPPGSAAPQQAQQVPQAAACRDTLATLFATLDRQDEASREQQRRVSLQVDGTSRLMQRSLSEREARQQALQVRSGKAGHGAGCCLVAATRPPGSRHCIKLA